jgi:hypothetical protein
MVSIGAAVTLIAAGGILRFTVATTSTHGLNVHVVGLILILAGLLGLVLSLLIWVLLNRRSNRPAGDGRAAPPLSPQRFRQDQPPATDDRRVHQNQPPD